MEIKKKLDAVVYKWDLSKSPFYQAWSMGTLTKEDLQIYASEYGAFIGLLPRGWETLGDKETEEEEGEHYELWEKFATSIDTELDTPKIASTTKLIETAEKLFAEPATAIGAMYAFEVQQPVTAQSKLKGLQEKYADFKADEEYFEEHCHNEHEAEKLVKLAKRLSESEQEEAIKASEEMSKALWDALDGVYAKHID